MILRAIGRAAAFIFLFLTGFAPHYRQDRTLWGLASLLTLNDWIVIGHVNTLNILWTILLLRMVFSWLEKTGRIALKLHEWAICCVAFFFTSAISQYGTIGLLIALSGFVYKHRECYATRIHDRFLAVAITLYGAIMSFLFGFGVSEIVTMVATLLFTWKLTCWFLQSPQKNIPCPVWAGYIITLTSRHSGTIYVVHLIVLGWLSGKPI